MSDGHVASARSPSEQGADPENDLDPTPESEANSTPESAGDPTSESTAGPTPDSASEIAPAPETAAGSPSAADTDDGTLVADLLPSLPLSGGESATVTIDVYVVTGRHGGLRVPERFCRECHLFARRADAAADAVDVDAEVRVLSWWTRFLGALRHGGYHPPVLVVDGQRLCQGHDVPTTDDVIAAIEDAADRGSTASRS